MFSHIKTIPKTTLNARNYASRCDFIFMRDVAAPFISNTHGSLFDGCTIYCWSTYLPSLFHQLNGLNVNNITLLSGDNDHSVRPSGGANKFSHIPPVPKNIKKWYAQNAEVVDDIMTPMPIGLVPPWRTEASESEHLATLTIDAERIGLVYSNFNIETNPEERIKIKNILLEKLKLETPYSDVNSYYKALQTHKFVICPPGNGKDTHRMWESLYFGAIPVVEDSVMNRYFSNFFPVVLISDWNEISEDFLNKQYNQIEGNFNYKLLDVDCWFKYYNIKNKND